jgi:hypothetical protein
MKEKREKMGDDGGIGKRGEDGGEDGGGKVVKDGG